jgi:hypothetical protein
VCWPLVGLQEFTEVAATEHGTVECSLLHTSKRTLTRVYCEHHSEFKILCNLSSRTMALGSTQPLTEMSTRNLSGGKWRPARKAENLTAICEPTV